MNELSEFFKTVSIEKTRVAEEKKRFEPRIEIKETDLSDFFGTIKTGQQNQIILAQRDGTKLDALQTFFTRLQTFEDNLQEQIERQKPGTTKDGFDPDEVAYDVETPLTKITNIAKGNSNAMLRGGVITLIVLGLILAVIIQIFKNNNDNDDI